MWALATLGHEPPEQSQTDAVCDHFAMLIKHRDESKRPNAHGSAIFMWALATLGHEPADQSMTDAVCDHFAMLIKHRDESKRPTAGGAAQFMWAVATLGHEPADEGFADAVCEHFAMFIKHLDALKRPSAREAANVMWALGKMKHAPADDVASAILERLTKLCDLPGQAPNSQDLSNTLFACAVLRLQVHEHVSTALVGGLLSLDRSVVDKQAYCNAAWSLAVSSMLSIDIFFALLERLQPLPVDELANDFSKLAQLYQALDFLQPVPTAAAQQLQEMVTRLGPRPLPQKRSAADQSAGKQLCAALGQLGLASTANVPLSGYWANAVLHPQHDSTAPVILVTDFHDYFKNMSKRCVRRFPVLVMPLTLNASIHGLALRLVQGNSVCSRPHVGTCLHNNNLVH